MGCSICLDDFTQADGDAKRATALPCGHMFHNDCLQEWFFGAAAAAVNQRRPERRRCPLCSAATDPAKMIRLFPSDGDDLDKYITGWRDAPNELFFVNADGTGGAADMDRLRLKHTKLLEDLMDFNHSMQGYIMSLHSCRSETRFRELGVKVRTVIMDLGRERGEDVADQLLVTINALENAAGEFSAMKNELARSNRACKTTEHKLLKERAQVQEEHKRTEENVKITAAKMATVEERILEVNKRWREAVASDRANQARTAELEAQKNSLLCQQRELTNKEQKLLLDTNIKISNIRNTTEAELASMRAKVAEAEQRAAIAERERAATHKKNCAMADQMKALQAKSLKRLSAAGPSKPQTFDTADKDRQITALRKELQNAQSKLASLGFPTPERRIMRNATNPDRDVFVDLTRSSSPASHDGRDTSPVTPREGQTIPSQASSSSIATVRAGIASPTPSRRKDKKRRRTSMSVETENLDDEMDDKSHPMLPGSALANLAAPLITSRAANLALARSASTNDFTSRDKHGTDHASSSKLNEKRKRRSADASTASNTSQSKKNYDWLEKKKIGVKLGPKHRPKEK